ncbi:MAG: LPS export ABC transporter periplasmic protein LptC [Pseudomonadota bacterium]
MGVLNPRLALSGAVLAILVIWAFSSFDDSPATSVDATPITTNEPDIQATDVEFTQLNPDGTLHYKLRASQIRQFDVEQLTRMQAPKLHMTSADQAPWDIDSSTGFIRKVADPEGVPEDVVYLRDGVNMVQTHPTSGLITLRSEVFYIFPNRQFAETDQSVMIDTEVGRTKAAGMKADLQSGKLTLVSDAKQRVHTIVLPEQFKKT